MERAEAMSELAKMGRGLLAELVCIEGSNELGAVTKPVAVA